MAHRMQFYVGLKTQAGEDMDYEGATEAITNTLKREGYLGFNMTHAYGFWDAEGEECLNVTVLDFVNTALSARLACEYIAKELAEQLDQECVLWQFEPVEAGLAEGNTEVEE